MVLAGGLLIKDLIDQTVFLYVLLRPPMEILVGKEAYITCFFFGGVVGLKLVCNVIDVEVFWLWYFGSIFAVLGAIYTAFFLFNQAKARDFG